MAGGGVPPDPPELGGPGAGAWRGVVVEHARWLPALPDGAEPVTLGEGNTPLIPATGLRALLGPGPHPAVFWKFEGTNPTGSFKDRGMAYAVTAARARGRRLALCASTGNTAASAAAYAARAGMGSAVVLPEGAVARGKLAQARVHGARIVPVAGGFDDALRLVRELAVARPDVALVNSVNPDRLEGQKTAAVEVCDALGRPPDALCIPVGNAGNVTAYGRGFAAWAAAEAGAGPVRPGPGAAAGPRGVPRLYGVQAAGAAPLVHGRPVPRPETVATAIRIGDPASADLARAAVEGSGGRFLAVPDAEILDAQRYLATAEGLFVEAASAAAVAGLARLVREGAVRAGETVVCVLTGHGLKDPDAADRFPAPGAPVAPRLDALADALADLLDGAGEGRP